MLIRLNIKKNIFRKLLFIATFVVAIIFVIIIINDIGYAEDKFAENFRNFKVEKIDFTKKYEVIENDDKTKTYIIYNFDGDKYEEEIIKTPYEIIKLKEATSSIIRENPYFALSEYKREELNNMPSNSFLNYENENSDMYVLDIGEIVGNIYYPVVLRKKSILKIPKEVIENMKILDVLIIFNVARNDMKPTDAWKFRYIEDIMVNRDGNHQIDTSDLKHTTCIDLKYRYKYENVNLMRFEYRQANNKSGYAYVDVDHVLDKDEVKFDSIDEIRNLDYKFLSDEWMVSYDNGDVDFYLRKWVTYKINIFKEVFDRAMVEIGNHIKSVRFDENGYVTYIN